MFAMTAHESQPHQDPNTYPDTMVPLSWVLTEVMEALGEGEGIGDDVQRAREVALRDSDSEVRHMEERAHELQEALDQDPENDDAWRELESLQMDYAKALLQRSDIPPA